MKLRSCLLLSLISAVSIAAGDYTDTKHSPGILVPAMTKCRISTPDIERCWKCVNTIPFKSEFMLTDPTQFSFNDDAPGVSDPYAPTTTGGFDGNLCLFDSDTAWSFRYSCELYSAYSYLVLRDSLRITFVNGSTSRMGLKFSGDTLNISGIPGRGTCQYLRFDADTSILKIMKRDTIHPSCMTGKWLRGSEENYGETGDKNAWRGYPSVPPDTLNVALENLSVMTNHARKLTCGLAEKKEIF